MSTILTLSNGPVCRSAHDRAKIASPIAAAVTQASGSGCGDGLWGGLAVIGGRLGSSISFRPTGTVAKSAIATKGKNHGM